MSIKNTFCAVAILAITSCSTMFNSGSQTISAVGANGEEGVKVEIRTPSGAYRTSLPATIVASPSTFNPTTVTVVDKCYDRTAIEVGKSVTPSFWANIFNYCIGCVIDPLTGAMWKLNTHVLIPLDEKESCKKYTKNSNS